MDESTKVLLAALIGASAGFAGQLIAAVFASRAERRRLAIETGFREWEQAREHAQGLKQGVQLFPPVLFVHFNYELLRLLDSRNGVTPDGYRGLVRRRDEIRDVIRADAERRQQEEAEQRRPRPGDRGGSIGP